MKLRSDAKKILTRAWSIRIIAISAILSGLEVALSLLDHELLGLPRGAFAALAAIVSALAIPARLMAQSSFAKDESGRVGKRTAGWLGGSAAALAVAVGLVGQWEGLSLAAYPDRLARDIPTVCYGETRGVKIGDVHTKAECDRMLSVALQEFEAGLDQCLKQPLPMETKVALVSWSYNVGIGAACKSTLVRKANAGDLVGACNELPKWNRAGGQVVRGLTNRRMAERALCLKGLA